jgi:hypothetical protein
LWCRFFYVDVRMRQRNERWLASADTPYGPSLGWGVTPDAALRMALQPFDGLIDELLATAPEPWKALGVGPMPRPRALASRLRPEPDAGTLIVAPADG